MRVRQTLKIWVIVLLSALAWVNIAQAGFGISPSQIKNYRLYPGAYYEKLFILSRGQPTEDLIARISVDFPNDPEVEKWFTIEPETIIPLPKGEQRVAMTVKINVPEDAEYKSYSGYLHVGTAPAEAVEKPGIAVALGARIDVDLTVTKIEIIDYKIRKLDIPYSEEGFHWWRIKLPGKIKFLMTIENIGNVDATPAKVEIEVYDLDWKNLLYQGEDKSLEKVKPFDTKEIAAEFWHELKPGQYIGNFKIFKNEEEILKEGKFALNVTPMEMSRKDWLILGGVILGTLIFIGIIILVILKRKKIIHFFKKLCVKKAS